ASASWTHVLTAIIPILPCLIVVYLLRWRVNLLSLGDDEARSLGVRPERLRMFLIVMVALMTAATVAVSGVLGWVGLVIPHLVRLLIGSDNRILLPGSALLGGLYMLVVDTMARSVIEVEIPVGILTAIIGAPVFAYLLVVVQKEENFLLNATGVGHRYSNKFDWLFRDLDVTIPPGEVVCVLGPTPRGKTTLLTCLAGIRTPREGRIEVTGSLGFVPQSHATDH